MLTWWLLLLSQRGSYDETDMETDWGVSALPMDELG